MRRFPTLGFVLAVLCMALSVETARAGDVSPGKLFYAKKTAAYGNTTPGSHWRSEIAFAAPLDASVSFSLTGCVRVGPSPCEGLQIAKGGARVFGADFVTQNFNGPTIGVVDVPVGLWSASSFLEFNDGTTDIAFTAPQMRWVLDNKLDDYRAATAARTGEKSTCATFFNDSTQPTAVQIISYGADGQRAKTVDGNTPPIDVYVIPANSAAQGCLADWYTPDGKELIAKGATFDAGSVRLSFGCAGVGPCPAPQRTWFLVTKGPLSGKGATVETLPVQNVGPVEATTASVVAQAAAGADYRDALVRVHGDPSPQMAAAIAEHNAIVRRMRSGAE